eukprot:TRINITY_DN3448_c0_g2_i1.p1 TRINITY_DN3448_c0_g2~~TRINITY_DN3448_c0_g2_i1.p1  ORF type:complete len:768 (+),score=143.87 TRINITY_DN3448_c0_g2_i1:93-2396(+)
MLHQWLMRRAVREGDDEQTILCKQVVTSLHPWVGVMALAIWVQSYMDGVVPAYLCALMIAVVASGGFFLYAIIFRHMPLWLLEYDLILANFALILADWANFSAFGTIRVWPMVILLMDILLLVGGRRWVQGVVLHSTAGWLFIVAVEESFRLRLLDIDGWTDSAEVEAQNRDRVDCADLPCALGPVAAGSAVVFFLLCLYLDFYATRGFAEGQRLERDRVMLMVRIAERVSACLVEFDLQAAEAVLSSSAAKGLTEELGGSFRDLLANLARYRPYLPQSCFERQDPDSSEFTPFILLGSNTGASPSGSSASSSAEAAALPISPSSKTQTNHSFSAVAHETPTGATPGSPLGDVHDEPKPCGLLTVPHRAASRLREGSESPRRASACPSLASSQVSAHSPVGVVTPPRPSSAVGHQALEKRISLLACNRTALLACIEQDPIAVRAELGAWMALEVTVFSEAVLAQRGVVDLLSADHQGASFGAFKMLVGHRMAAARCAAELCGLGDGAARRSVSRRISAGRSTSMLQRLPRTSSICTGLAVCGDFGSAVAQRFMIFGGVSPFSAVLERIAAGWGCAVLVEGNVHSDAKMHWDFRLRQVLHFAKHSPRPIKLWELCSERRRARGGESEWMYELDAALPNPWETYNEVVTRWCDGDVPAALAVLALARTEGPARLVAALAGLRQALTDPVLAAHPPCCTVPLAAGVGRGAPTREKAATWNSSEATVGRSFSSVARSNYVVDTSVESFEAPARHTPGREEHSGHFKALSTL